MSGLFFLKGHIYIKDARRIKKLLLRIHFADFILFP